MSINCVKLAASHDINCNADGAYMADFHDLMPADTASG